MAEINLNERISQSEDLIHWLDRFIEGKSVPSNERAIIVAGCLNVSLEHHKSIVLTTTAEFYGLEKKDAFNIGVLSNIKNDSWAAMNSFTHAGVLPINRYFSATEIGSNFQPTEIKGALDFADTFALMAVLGIINVSTGTTEEREALATQIIDRCKEFADAD
jgi:hypothetical protein